MKNIIFLIIIMVLASCQSFVKKSENETLYVIATGVKNQTKNSDVSGTTKIIIRNKILGFRKSYILKEEGYIFIKNLEPGRYEILNYNNIEPSSMSSFIIKEDSREVTYFHSRVFLVYSDNCRVSVSSTPLTDNEIEKLSKSILLLYPELSEWNWP